MSQQKGYVGNNKEYEIQLDKEIGSGAYGKVYECQNINDRNQKLCAKIVAMVQTEEKNLQREKEINELIQQSNYNPNLVRVFYVCQETHGQGKVLVFIMEKCDSNLQKLMDQKSSQKQPFSIQELDTIMKQIISGYQVLYEKNIVHRDIKPENILIKYEQNQVVFKLADFGVGKVYKANDFKMTKAGTPVFSSPEINVIYSDPELDKAFTQFSKEGKTKSCVDIFSIGIILHKLALNTYPFPTTKEGIPQFFRTIKINPLIVNHPNQTLKSMIEGMLRYYPKERTTFAQLFLFYQIPFNQNRFTNFQQKFDSNQQNQGPNNNQFGNNQQQNFKNNFPQANQNNFPQANQNNFPQANQNTFPQANQNNFPQANQNNFPQANQNNINVQQQNFQQQNNQQQNLQQPNFSFNNNNQQQQQNFNNNNQQQNQNNIIQPQPGLNNQQGSMRFTNPALKQTINNYLKIFQIQYDKIISDQFRLYLNQINFSGITNTEQIKALKNYFFPIKKDELQFFRPEHIAFLYSIACLDKNFQDQYGNQSTQVQIDYLSKNPF